MKCPPVWKYFVWRIQKAFEIFALNSYLVGEANREWASQYKQESCHHERGHWNRWPGEVLDPPSLVMFKKLNEQLALVGLTLSREMDQNISCCPCLNKSILILCGQVEMTHFGPGNRTEFFTSPICNYFCLKHTSWGKSWIAFCLLVTFSNPQASVSNNWKLSVLAGWSGSWYLKWSRWQQVYFFLVDSNHY